jgi:hypothetical protein
MNQWYGALYSRRFLYYFHFEKVNSHFDRVSLRKIIGESNRLFRSNIVHNGTERELAGVTGMLAWVLSLLGKIDKL